MEYYSETIKHENTHEPKMCQIPDFISQDTSLWIKIHTYTRLISQIQTCGSKSKPLPETLPKTLPQTLAKTLPKTLRLRA